MHSPTSRLHGAPSSFAMHHDGSPPSGGASLAPHATARGAPAGFHDATLLHGPVVPLSLLTQVEDRCLQLVSVAEAQARAQRADLEKQLAALKAECADQLEALDRQASESARQLDRTIVELERSSLSFNEHHRESSAAFSRLLQERADCETRIIQSCRTMFRQFDEYRAKLRKTALDRMVASVTGWITSQSQRFQQYVPSAGPGAVRGFLEEHVASALRSSNGVVSTTVSTPPSPASLALTSLIHKFVEIVTSKSNDEDRPFLLEATFAYLIGAVQCLAGFGDVLTYIIEQSYAEERSKRTLWLLDTERSVFKSNLYTLCPPKLVDITPEALSVLLLQKLYDDRQLRYEACVALLRDAQTSSAAQLRAAFDNVHAHVAATHDVVVSRFGDASSSALAAAAGPNAVLNLLPAGVLSMLHQANVSSQGSASLSSLFQSAAMGGGGSSSSVPSDFALALFRHFCESSPERIFSALLHSHQEEYSKMKGETLVAIEELRRSARANPTPIVEQTTVFKLGRLKQELEHEALLRRVGAEVTATDSKFLQNQLAMLTDRVQTLLAEIEGKNRDISELRSLLQKYEMQVGLFDSVVKHRNSVHAAITLEVKTFSYEINMQSFGETWQESMFRMRERIMTEIRDEHTRLVSRINAYVRNHVRGSDNLEEVYEARLQSMTTQLTTDCENKIRDVQRRCDLATARIRDEADTRIENARLDADEEVTRSKQTFAQDYERHVSELNQLYESKSRRLENRMEERETYFSEKLRSMRRQLLDKEAAMEAQFNERCREMTQRFEEEKQVIRQQFMEKESMLERDRLAVMASIEEKTNAKMTIARSHFEELTHQLQEHALSFITQQRQAFEEHRQEEHLIFSSFTFASHRTHQKFACDLIHDMNEKLNTEAANSLEMHAEAIETLHTGFRSQLQTKEDDLLLRTQFVKKQQEDVLRVTQELRVEQDEKLFTEITNKLGIAAKQRAQVTQKAEALVQKRYYDLVHHCNIYLQSDIMAAHQTFERECRARQIQMLSYANHFHRMQLFLEAAMWEEIGERRRIEREYHATLMSIRVSEIEVRGTLRHVALLNGKPFHPLSVFSEDDMTEVRREYEARLLQQQQCMATMASDYLTVTGAHLKQHKNENAVINTVLNRRTEVLMSTLQQRFEEYYTQRAFVVDKSVADIHRAAEAVVVNYARASLVGAHGAQEPRKVHMSYGDTLTTDIVSGTAIPREALLSTSPRPARGRMATNLGAANGTNGPAQRRALSAGSRLQSMPVNTINGPRDNQENYGHTAAGKPRLGGSKEGGAVPPNAGTSEPVYVLTEVEYQSLTRGSDSDSNKIVQYFASLRDFFAAAFGELETRIHTAIGDKDRTHQIALRNMQKTYLDASAALMSRIEGCQQQLNIRDIALRHLIGQVEMKSAAEVNAAALTSDLAVLMRDYEKLSCRWMAHIGFASIKPAPSRGGGGVDGADAATGGAPLPIAAQRMRLAGHPPLEADLASQANDALSSEDAGTGRKMAFVSDFVTNLGSKAKSKSLVLENILLSEKITALELLDSDTVIAGSRRGGPPKQ